MPLGLRNAVLHDGSYKADAYDVVHMGCYKPAEEEGPQVFVP